MCISTEILNEYAEIIDRFYGPEVSNYVLNVIINSRFAIFVTPSFCFNLIASDPDDNKFVDCAVCGNAKFIVTDDHHYKVLEQIDFPHVDVVGLDSFNSYIANL